MATLHSANGGTFRTYYSTLQGDLAGTKGALSPGPSFLLSSCSHLYCSSVRLKGCIDDRIIVSTLPLLQLTHSPVLTITFGVPV